MKKVITKEQAQEKIFEMLKNEGVDDALTALAEDTFTRFSDIIAEEYSVDKHALDEIHDDFIDDFIGLLATCVNSSNC